MTHPPTDPLAGKSVLPRGVAANVRQNRAMRAEHVFADETKQRGLLMTAAAVASGELQDARKLLRGLIMPRQRRIHFYRESDGRRKKILDMIGDLGPECVIYDASSRPRRVQRETCLRALVADLAVRQARLLVLERDESVCDLDRKVLFRSARDVGYSQLEYRHLRGHEEPLLAIPDAIAWCWQRGGEWRHRIRELVTEVRKL